jgi:hypothetical protein
MNYVHLYKSREDLATNRFHAFINGAKPTYEFVPVGRIVHVSMVSPNEENYHFESRPAFGRKSRWRYTSEEVWNEILETGKRLPTTIDPEAVTDYYSLLALGMDERIIVVDGSKQPAT